MKGPERENLRLREGDQHLGKRETGNRPFTRLLQQARHPVCSFFLAPIILTGCLYYDQSIDVEMPAHRFPTEQKEHPFLERRPKVSPKVVRSTEEAKFTIEKLRFPTFTAYHYIPKGLASVPGIVVLPISNGNYHAERMAEFLASNGYACFRMKTRKEILGVSDTENPLNEFERRLKSYLMDILQGIDWFSEHPGVDRSRMGLVGMSLGAIAGSIVSGVDPRIKASVFILGGGDLPGIFMTSKEKSVREVRQKIKKGKGLSNQEVNNLLDRKLHSFDPIRYAESRDPSRILMINAYLDQVIKREYAAALWKAWGQPFMIQIPTGHYSAVIFLPYARHKTLDHFDQLLGGSKNLPPLSTQENLIESR